MRSKSRNIKSIKESHTGKKYLQRRKTMMVIVTDIYRFTGSDHGEPEISKMFFPII